MKILGLLFAFGALVIAGAVGVFWVKVRPSDYPFQETITNAEGKSADFEILGRSADRVYARRADDSNPEPTQYELPIEDLDLQTRLILKTMPEKAPPAAPKEVDSYVKSRKKEIARLERNLEELESERDSAASGEKRIGAQREWDVEISRVEAEIAALKKAIAAREKR